MFPDGYQSHPTKIKIFQQYINDINTPYDSKYNISRFGCVILIFHNIIVFMFMNVYRLKLIKFLCYLLITKKKWWKKKPKNIYLTIKMNIILEQKWQIIKI